MTIPIIVFGSLILLSGVLLIASPETIFGFLRNNIENSAIHVIAVMVRLIIGILLLTQSSLSKYPLAINSVGWFFIVAGISLAVIGRNNFGKLLSWVLVNLKPFGRFAGLMAIAFGGFLVYAFI